MEQVDETLERYRFSLLLVLEFVELFHMLTLSVLISNIDVNRT